MSQEAEDRVFENLNYKPLFAECEGCGKVISSKEMYCQQCKKPDGCRPTD